GFRRAALLSFLCYMHICLSSFPSVLEFHGASDLCSSGTETESIPMKTLQCYNDYISLTTCTWIECSEAHQFMNVTLNFNNCCEK
uniref:Cytokine receptor common subunit beta N-terminal domain-containing protein n=1 Tax=Strix occidentalis caurina TaxID=311401 RepID=A0A8D0EXZ9_STROC